MRVIYEPKGRAKEYADLAFNVYMGCSHGCKYCYAPACLRKKPEDFRENITARWDTLEKFVADCDELACKGDERRILFSFLSDPYQPEEAKIELTRLCLMRAVCSFGRNIDILTKGKYDLVSRDFDIMEKNPGQVRLGVSLCFIKDESRQEWEPYASPVEDRIRLIKEAHKRGITTWVSVEPVIYPGEAIEVMKTLMPYVDVWKVGKLNHNKALEKKVNWYKFLKETLSVLHDREYHIKKDLLATAILESDEEITPRPMWRTYKAKVQWKNDPPAEI